MEAGRSDFRGQTSSANPPMMFTCAGGHCGPPLRRGFVSMRATWDTQTDLTHSPNPTRPNVATRCAVECGAGGPLAGLASYQILKASSHLAAGRAGTIQDGQFHDCIPRCKEPPSRMVDPLSQQTIPPSLAEPNTRQNFA